MKPLTRLACLALLLAGRPLSAQATPQMLLDALATHLNAPGGCFGKPDTASVHFEQFPAVTFLRGQCTFEHGFPASAVVGTDSTGTVFLLGDLLGMRYLLDRHRPVLPTSRDFPAFAWTLLELSGYITTSSVLIADPADLPQVVQDSLRGVAGVRLKPWCDLDYCGARFLATTPGYGRESVNLFRIAVYRPMLVIIQDSLVWSGRDMTRFAVPRTREDSALARVAGARYGEAYANAIFEHPDGLAELLEMTPRLSGSAADTHIFVLSDLLNKWGDERFAGELERRSLVVQTAVVSGLTKDAGPETWRFMPCMTRLAATLGVKR